MAWWFARADRSVWGVPEGIKAVNGSGLPEWAGMVTKVLCESYGCGHPSSLRWCLWLHGSEVLRRGADDLLGTAHTAAESKGFDPVQVRAAARTIGGVMGTAVWLRDLEGYAGPTSLYRLDPPLENGVTHVVVTVRAQACQTLVFRADSAGRVPSDDDLASVPWRSHVDALENLGYRKEKA